MNNRFKAVLFGVLLVYGLMLSASFILALFVRFDWISTQSLDWLPFLISLTIMLLGGGLSGFRSSEKGWLSGVLVGVIYTVMIMLYQFLAHDVWLHDGQWLHFITFLLASISGGIIGVQLNQRND
ncbi:putative membrane protein (TIGR04086 family) [Alkalibacillus flavidus]|uniref:Membrane protein (TIGR04086 family) n=1 Tax=Alkalibacillus flavidus TaxID=546021 RepID=A0ABV2KSG9_9BACI